MPLRPVSDLGLADATDLAAAPPLEARSQPARPRPSQREGKPQNDEEHPQRPVHCLPPDKKEPTARASAAVALSDEPTPFLQIMVPGELHERLTDASYALMATHPRLRHQKTIIGALIWRHVDPQDPGTLRTLGQLLDAYVQSDLSQVPAEIKVGAHIPFSLKYRLDGAALALRRTRRAASAKTLLSALIWHHVATDRLEALTELLAAYHDETRQRPGPLPGERETTKSEESSARLGGKAVTPLRNATTVEGSAVVRTGAAGSSADAA